MAAVGTERACAGLPCASLTKEPAVLEGTIIKRR